MTYTRNFLRRLIQRKHALLERVHTCEQHKKKVETLVQRSLPRYVNRELSLHEFNAEITRRLGGREVHSLIASYDSFISTCRLQIHACEREITRVRMQQFFKMFLFIVIPFSLLAFVAFSPLGVTITGFSVFGMEAEEYSDTLSRSFSEDSVYLWSPDHKGNLSHVFVSGVVEGNGTARVFFNDLLVYEFSYYDETPDKEEVELSSERFEFTRSCGVVCEGAEGKLIAPYELRIELQNATLTLSALHYRLFSPPLESPNDPIQETHEPFDQDTASIVEEPSFNASHSVGVIPIPSRNETYPSVSVEHVSSHVTSVTLVDVERFDYADFTVIVPIEERVRVDHLEQIHVFLIGENEGEPVDFSALDRDTNGYIDTLSWLSKNNTQGNFEIILIIAAEHLDAERNFISDIFADVKELDGRWSEPIPDQHYVRVTFETNLTSDNDVTLYPRVISGTPRIDVYEADSERVIVTFTRLEENTYNKVYLTALISPSQNRFDLRVVDGVVAFDHIIDPATTYLINADASNVATSGGNASNRYDSGRNLIRLNSNTLAAYWEDASNDASCAQSTTEGVTWGAYNSFAGTHEGPALATNGSGIVYVLTGQTGAGDTSFVYNRTGLNVCDATAGTWADVSASLVSQGNLADVAYDGSHNRFVLCSPGLDFDIDFAYSSAVTGLTLTWTAATAISGAATINTCSLDVTDNGNVFVAAKNTGASSITVYNSSLGTFASTTSRTAYGSQVNDVHLSARGSSLLITAVETSTSDLVVVNSSDGITYSNLTYVGTFNDAQGCIDSNNNFHVIFVNGTGIDYVKVWANGTFSALQTVATTGTERYPSVRCTNFPSNNRLGESEMEFVYTDTGTNTYFVNFTIDTSAPPVDSIPPVVNLMAPANGSTVTASSQSFNATFSDTVALVNATFYLWNATALVNVTTTSLSGTAGSINLSVVLPHQGNFSWNYRAFDSALNAAFNSTNYTLSYVVAANTAPSITFVSPLAAADPTENGVKIIHLNFTATDTDGSSNINDTSARVYLQRAGQTTRSNVTCAPLGSAFGNSKNFTCAVGIQYFDGAGSWTLNTTIFDVNAATAENSTSSFTYNQLTAFVLSPPALSWSTLYPGDLNRLASTGLLLNNTGNDPIDTLTITAINLLGEVNSLHVIPAANFTVHTSDVCDVGTSLVNGTAISIIGGVLSLGNHSANDGSTGQEQLYFCLEHVPNALISQAYSSSGGGAWEIAVLLAAFAPSSRRKRKVSGEGNLLTSDNLIKVLDAQLQEAYGVSFNELIDRLDKKELDVRIPLSIFSQGVGVAESLCKYLHENKGMRFSVISRLVHRDQRTINANYRNACKKKNQAFTISADDFSVPLTIFGERTLTLFESLVLYLRNKGHNNIEVARLLGKDPRNVWAVYQRVSKKSVIYKINI